MSSRKRWKFPECSAQLACDGVQLRPGRVESGMCGKCEKAKALRGKVIPPRGEGTKNDVADE
jgi:hypothetical protein